MKTLLSFLLIAGFASAALADIQDPPANDYGPTRKLGRALANISPLCNLAEASQTICMMEEREGNSAGWTYGPVKALGRVCFRTGMGFYELFTFPFPLYKGSYRPPYKSNIPWIHGGYTEFSPEIGFESRYRYDREGTVY